MPHLIEVSSGTELDADNVVGFNIMFGERHYTGGEDGERIEVDYRSLPRGIIGAITTGDGEIKFVDSEHFRAFIQGGERSQLCVPLAALLDVDLSQFHAEANNLIFQDGSVISIPRYGGETRN